MNAFTESNIACAQVNVARALALLEKHAATELPDPRLLSAAYAELLDAKGRIAAAVQLETLEAELAGAETERPSCLRLVTE